MECLYTFQILQGAAEFKSLRSPGLEGMKFFESLWSSK